MDPQTQPELSSEAPDDSASDVSAKLSAQQLLLHNAVLRRNFEHLKDLHLKLSQANLNLRETCRQLQFEKMTRFGFNLWRKTTKLLLARWRLCVLKGIKPLQKRRHLKLNIPSWSHQKEKSNHIERKWGISLIREDICTFEQERESDQKAWKMEKFDFQKQMDEYERDKEKNKDIRGNLEAEVADLHAMLTGLEQVIQDAEKRHADAIKLMRNENMVLQEDLQEVRKDGKLAKESFVQAQNEVTELHAEAGGLRAQLQAALNDAHQQQQDAVNCRERALTLMLQFGRQMWTCSS